MHVIPFVHEGLGNSSYLVDLGNSEALLVDPDRSVDRYLRVIEERRLRLAGVFETHLHADFVSGAHELQARTNAPLFIAGAAHARLPHRALEGGQSVDVAAHQVRVVGSPGHTPEHLSYALSAAAGPPLLFSGGSLIVGGAARTDLISPQMTDILTRAQYRTLRDAFVALPDETLLYPTHGGGSFCSTGAGAERTSTLGNERRDNPLLAFDSEDEFAAWFPSTFPAAPDYFFRLRAVNQAGARLRRDIPMPPALDTDEFAARATAALVIDLRSKEEYAGGHIPGSLSNPLRDDYAVWLGWLVPEATRLLFVSGAAPVDPAVDESLLVGHESFAGWLQGGLDAWQRSGRPLASSRLVDAVEARRLLKDGALSLDVREASEWDAGHIEGAVHIPLGRLSREADRLPKDRPVVVYCGHGERASTGVSLLERAGFDDLVNLDGGFGSWSAAESR